MRIPMAIALATAFLAWLAPASATELTITDLRCEYGTNPLGIDSPAPRLFWKLTSAARGQRQKAYQVLAASTAERLASNQADLWNSGKVQSDASIQIAYAGKPLGSSQPVFWKVRVWDKDGAVSPWSAPASWTMGLLHPTDWQAQWIGATDRSKAQTLLLRKEFILRPGLRRAVVHLCGLGYYELSLNGRKVGDALFP
ncbi:MAG TPA: alpha-L-rhamnosidase N-terminal domain-containing protein, partial [Bacillota bacterium]|nr:alpha-L-rhamnosidase N-terminal domain-containing protein [Bacillota bacterium]